jgi:choloylglycine hydrolase
MMCFLKQMVVAVCFSSLVVSLLAAGNTALACTRVLSDDNGQAVLVGRTMDLHQDTGTALWIVPRGIKRDGQSGPNSLVWTSKYGSIVTVSYMENGIGAVNDGMNEKGLTANGLWLQESNYGARDEQRPGLFIGQFVQYMLDNCATVDEAVQAIQKGEFQATTIQFPGGGSLTLQLCLADQSGDSAIIEYINGKPVIYHDKQYVVVTNDPQYKNQLENLKQYYGFGGQKPLPGTKDSKDRFVRAAYYMKNFPKTNNLNEALAAVMSITRNVSEPYSSPDAANPYTTPTIWRTIADLTHLCYYFESTASLNTIYTNLADFKLAEGSPAMSLDLRNNPAYYGDVTKSFIERDPARAADFSLQ